MVPVTEVKSVAGQWAGTLARDTNPREDWVRVTIDQDGTYDFSSARQIGVLTGKGTLSVKDGKLVGESPRGTSVYTLYDRGGEAGADRGCPAERRRLVLGGARPGPLEPPAEQPV